MKAHLLVFDGDRIALKQVISIVDHMPEIENWHVVFSNTICIASSIEAKRLASRFNDLLPDIRYLISEVQPEKKGGRMNSTIFELMNAPSPAERELA
jgi:hypothetical protein